jgi:KaiC/GvpD/RAD55 family RecA-like ATPase
MDGFDINSELDIRKDSRVSTGINGLDDLLSGGFPKGSVILVTGTPGTGKTIVCLQYVKSGIEKGDKCLYLTSDESVNDLIDVAKDLEFECKEFLENGELKFIYLDLNKQNIHQEIEDQIKTGNYDRMVLDSLSPLSEIPLWMVNNGNEVIPSANSMNSVSYPIESTQATRIRLRHLINIFKEEKCTTLFTSEIPGGSRQLSRDSISEFLSDGIILLDLDATMDRRKLTIRKMRGTKHTLKPQDIEITKNGIQLL